MNLVAAVPLDGHRMAAARAAAACHRPPRGPAAPPVRWAGYEEHHPEPVPARVLASSTVRLAFGLADPIAVPGRAVRSPSVVTGVHAVASELVLAGVQRGVALRCDPLTAHALLGGVPMHELGGTAVDLADVLGRRLTRLVEQVAEAPGWSGRFAALGAGLAALPAAGPMPDPALRWAWRRLQQTGGAVRVEALAAELGWSPRHLARRFREQVGVAPKAAARIVRFERAAALLAREHRGLSAVAADTGYADHAHLTREVRSLARWTPTELGRGLRLLDGAA